MDCVGHFIAASRFPNSLQDPDLCCELEVCKQHSSSAGQLPIKSAREALGGDWTAGEGRRDLRLLLVTPHPGGGSRLQPPTWRLSLLPEAASWSLAVGAEDGAANEIRTATILQVLKTQQGEAAEQSRHCDCCRQDIQAPPRAHHGRSGDGCRWRGYTLGLLATCSDTHEYRHQSTLRATAPTVLPARSQHALQGGCCAFKILKLFCNPGILTLIIHSFNSALIRKA